MGLWRLRGQHGSEVCIFWNQQGFGGSKNLRLLLSKDLRFVGIRGQHGVGTAGRDFQQGFRRWGSDFNIQCLKGLSYEIDFKTLTKFTELVHCAKSVSMS